MYTDLMYRVVTIGDNFSIVIVPVYILMSIAEKIDLSLLPKEDTRYQ